MASSDSQLELKRRARRRLVGAVALALLAAVVLPMVMDHEPRQSSQDIQIRIPGQDQGAIAHGTPAPQEPDKPGAGAAAEGSAAPRAEAEPDTRPAAATATAPVAKPPAAAPAETRPAPAPAASSERADAAAKAPVAPPPKPDAAPAKPAADASKAAADAAQAQREAERVRAALEGRDAGQYYLQIGVFADAANARNILAKSQAQGVAAKGDTVDVKGQKSTRVRAGPFASRDEAERARAKLKQAGLDGKLLEAP
ncbi:MAG: SPOR domain-containing protein [Rhodocyclaceae bacterium]|nr:SPOR domain-containing protein [Rhodocyclaceae bacterium]